MGRAIIRLVQRNGIALLALFLALGGTTYAASTALIGKNTVASPQVVNGSLKTIDLSKKARKALHGAKGAKGNKGNAGAKGPTGAQGAQGATGAQGPFPSGSLPAGNTVRGYWAIGGSGTSFWLDGISYGFRMSAALTAHLITLAGTPPAECPGTTDDPAAQAGHVCIFVKENTNMNNPTPFNTTKQGLGIFSTVVGGTVGFIDGTWAATSS